MTDPHILKELREMQLEFNSENTTEPRRVELLTKLRSHAETDPANQPPKRCAQCHQVMFYAPHPEALIEGHVYSGAGLKEYRISGFCEYCYDKATLNLGGPIVALVPNNTHDPLTEEG